MDALFLIKVAAVPFLLWGTSLAVRRWGPFLGALLAGLPLVSGPVSLFITLEQGTQFGAGMAYNTLPGICVCVAYTVIYAWLSRRFRWPLALLFGMAAYFAMAALLCVVPRSLPLFTVLALSAPLIGLRLLPHQRDSWRAPPAHKGPPLMQMLVGTLAMIAETEGAAWLGPQWSGILVFFPVISGVMALFAHIEIGGEAALRVCRGTLTGFSGATVYAVIVAWCVTALPVGVTYSLAAAGALVASGLLGWKMKH